MSSRTTSGRRSADQLEGGRAVVGHLDVLAQRAEQDAQAGGVAAVVVDDQDAPARELAGRVVGRRLVAGRPAAASAETGRRTVNSLPWPGPSLWAVTRPPCISTSDRTRVRPIPRPPRERDRVWSAWVNRSKIVGQQLRRDADPVVADADDDLAARAARRSARSRPPRRCTWRRCSAGWRAPAPAAPGRPPAARDRAGSATVSRCWQSSIRGRLASTARLDHDLAGRPAPSGGRSCRG